LKEKERGGSHVITNEREVQVEGWSLDCKTRERDPNKSKIDAIFIK
jgi:hypothetical protein